MQGITRVELALPYRLGRVNCYIVKSGAGFLLIDTGASNSRAKLEEELVRAGCRHGNLNLILLTHGDFDHIGNAAYLSGRFGARSAMHQEDAGMAEHGDMFWNRSSRNALLGIVAPILFRFPKADRFTPDLDLKDCDDLSPHGFDARVLSMPGHSKGSIGILTAGGDLFCGDLLENNDAPAISSIMDERITAEESIKRLLGLQICTVYPGHGDPFSMESYSSSLREEIAGQDQV